MREIERKFLVVGSEWKQSQIVDSHEVIQVYVLRTKVVEIRVCIKESNTCYSLIKLGEGLKRYEFELKLPVWIGKLVSGKFPYTKKRRNKILTRGKLWEIDEYEHPSSIVIAEVELASEVEEVEILAWATTEVTYDKRYKDKWLAKR